MQLELIIAIVSGVLTLVASFIVAIYQARVEFGKMSKQLESKYTTSLFEKHLAIYPELFKILTDLNNAIEKDEQDKDKRSNHQRHFDSWMSANAIFLRI